MEKKDKIRLGLAIGTLGIVYGDIGTSPLYVMKSIVASNGGLNHVSEDYIIGSLSLIFWTLTLLTSIKYVIIALRADNHGEGGIFSLYALVRKRGKWLIIPAMIGGAALLADGVLTPAVTVTSAIEGLEEIPTFEALFTGNTTLIVIIVIVILSCIFFMQRYGTMFIGRIFGPTMLIWFSILGILGIINILGDLSIFRAFSPYYAVELLFSDQNKAGFLILGSVFLATTGAEALYSDLGHVGRKNIYITWPFVKVCLILNYFGQGAWILSLKKIDDPFVNPFFQSMPEPFIMYGVLIATLAAIIASQSLITGAYTLVSEAIALNLLPRLNIRYPSETKGQVYIPAVTGVLWIACVGVVLYFRDSSHMEAAYGLSITVTMLMTTILLFQFLLQKGFSVITTTAILMTFGVLEFAFFISSAAKFMHGGFVAVIIAVVIMALMYIWFTGYYIKSKLVKSVPIKKFIPSLTKLKDDGAYPKFAHNLVYLTSNRNPARVEHAVMASILDKRPKRADVYWFVNVQVVDGPYAAYYTVESFDTDFVVRVQLKLGFRVEQDINVFLHQIAKDLISKGKLAQQKRKYSTATNRTLGDFCFVLVQDELSTEADLTNWQRSIMKMKLFIKRFTTSPESWFGLEYSDVQLENVPLYLSKKKTRKIREVN
ncbi:KUP/HAK/KT family potassium transporter [Listeria booriae]|uniref:Probable potassium transport system protein Kup n=1 Tax=Listeria booriae TaxID=1552123 RepID=A0A7X0WEB3_9LIST|nr:KUP/HAK/KT family potassium transporter [Listeria booriae]MBC1332068.1 potassium transporter Kup [Listeria booriae]MBC2386990.1 potassium transporter Kup [Listeria booriae]